MLGMTNSMSSSCFAEASFTFVAERLTPTLISPQTATGELSAGFKSSCAAGLIRRIAMSGDTVMHANLLRRLSESSPLPKP
jgi:hypothetical protein